MSRGIYLGSVVGALIALLGASGCGSGETKAEASGVSAPRVSNVAIYRLAPDTLTQYSTLPATAVAWRSVALGFEEGGKVVEVYKDMGSRVEAGEPLARLDTKMLGVALIEAEAGLKFQRFNYDGIRQLFEEGSISEQDFYSAEYNLRRAESAYQTFKERLDHAVLRAPFAGKVSVRSVEMGQQVQAGQQVFQLVQTDTIKVQAFLPENEIAGFTNGAQVEVRFDAYATRIFSGQVGRISPAATSSQRVFPLEVFLDNTDGLIRAGMIGKLKLMRRALYPVVVIPRSAIVERETGAVAFVVQKDRVQMRQLKLGASEDDRIVVEDGLEFGDRVVVSGGRDLIDGDRVAVREEVVR